MAMATAATASRRSSPPPTHPNRGAARGAAHRPGHVDGGGGAGADAAADAGRDDDDAAAAAAGADGYAFHLADAGARVGIQHAAVRKLQWPTRRRVLRRRCSGVRPRGYGAPYGYGGRGPYAGGQQYYEEEPQRRVQRHVMSSYSSSHGVSLSPMAGW
ncbi:hypothetical protein HU200_014449 [Digitaria exilis]|uniref:Uncharacterized protein n=1 Tax=Digitaria exilis TaxID=1010633 RepID=A0A835KMW1_9POAL|nr:hypothetical protein HU200_014449 [Digitaria exilis]